LSDDPTDVLGAVSHPIRDTTVIDTVVNTDRGAYYGLVIASPLSGDIPSQQRLLDKLEAYIADFYSDKYLTRYGRPRLDNCKITVGIHPDSDAVIFELLEKCRAWVEGNNISFAVKTDLLGSAPH
jgi:hypothetical protein